MVQNFKLDWEDDQPFSSKRIFIGRYELRNTLIEAVDHPQYLHEHRVKVFYGAGGQGKSALKNDFFVKEFLKEREDDKDLLCINRLDFESQIGTRLADEALLLIAQDLIEKGKIPLPAFALGFLRYKIMTSGEVDFKKKYSYLYKIGFVDNDIAGEFFNTIITAGLEWTKKGLSELPGVGFFINKISEKGYAKLVEWIQTTKARRVLGDLDELNSIQLMERLPVLLAYDLHSYLKGKKEGDNIIPRKRIVILIDGYEKLWEDNRPDIHRDAWIQKLVEQMPGVLFLIFGREKILWADTREIFKDIIEQYELKGLTEAEARQFLNLSGITNTEIEDQIISSSKSIDHPEDGCLPFYLNLQVETLQTLIKAGKAPDKSDFDKRDEEVIDHFLEHINPEISRALITLSLAPYIDDEIIELFFEERYISVDINIKGISRYSFISFDGNRATIHGLMRDKAIKKFESEAGIIRVKKIYVLLFRYFESKLPSEPQQVNDEIEKTITLASLCRELSDKLNFYTWACEMGSKYYGDDAHGSMSKILQKGLDFYFENKKGELGKENIETSDIPATEAFTIAKMNFMLGSRYLWMNKYRKSLEYFKSCTAYLDSLVSNENAINRTEILALRKSSLEMTAMNLETLLEYWEAEKYHHEARGFLNSEGIDFDLIGWTKFYTSLGIFSHAEPTLYKEYKKNVDNNSEYLGYISDLFAMNLFMQRRYDEAIKYHEKAVSVYKSLMGADSIYYANANLSMAHTLTMQGSDLEMAFKILEEVCEIYKLHYEEDNVNFGYLHTRLGEFYATKGIIEKALYHYNMGSLILARKVGPISKNVMKNLFNKALLIERLFNEGLTDLKIYQAVNREIYNKIRDESHIIEYTYTKYEPALYEMLALSIRIVENEGDQELATELSLLQKELTRMLTSIHAVRLDNFPSEAVSEGLQTKIDQFRSVMSLPESPENLEIYKFHLPFYETFDLYKVSYKNTSLSVERYLLASSDKVEIIDYGSSPIYNISEWDGHFTSENVYDYLTFFFDCVSGVTFMYSVDDPLQMPWCVYGELSEDYKNSIIRHLRPYKLLAEDENILEVELFMLHGCNLLKTNCSVFKKDVTDTAGNRVTKGNIVMSSGAVCYFDGELRFFMKKQNDDYYTDSSGNIAEVNPEDLSSQIYAYKDNDSSLMTPGMIKKFVNVYHLSDK